MPRPVRFFIKTGLAFFVFAMLLALGMVAQPVLSLPSIFNSLMPTYLHLFMVGWITQMIFGVSIWMFPSPESGGRYGNESVIWGIYWTLNVGLLLRFVAEPGNLIFQGSFLIDFGLVLSALLQWVSALLYTYHIWGRVRGK